MSPVSMATVNAVVKDAFLPVLDGMNRKIRRELPGIDWAEFSGRAIVVPIPGTDETRRFPRERMSPVRVELELDVDTRAPCVEWDEEALDNAVSSALSALRRAGATSHGARVFIAGGPGPLILLSPGGGDPVMYSGTSDRYEVRLGMYYAVVPPEMFVREEVRHGPVESWADKTKRKRAARPLSAGDIRVLEGLIPPQIDPEQARKLFEAPDPGLFYGINRSVLRDGKEVHEPALPLAVGDHVMLRLSPVEEQRCVVAQIGPGYPWTTAVRIDGSGGSSRVVKVADLRKVDPIPTHEPPTATRGRARLKPGVTL